MIYSHSRTELFERCKFAYYCRYVLELDVLPNYEAQNPLVMGTAMHEGIEKGVEFAVKYYTDHYPVMTDLMIDEITKMETLVERARDALPDDMAFERHIVHQNFQGYLDGLVKVDDGVYDLYDFKYSNAIDRYKESRQLHVYKYFFERATGQRINRMFYAFIPKTMIRQKKTENQFQFRQRLMETLEHMTPTIVEITYDQQKVLDFYDIVGQIEATTEYPPCENRMCDFCEYKDYCQKEETYMLLPKADRRTIGEAQNRRIWIYGQSFSGKTTMLDGAPNPLNLNTDGNINFVTMPFIRIADRVTKTGRTTERVSAWDVFKEALTELEAGDNEFQTIIIDLLEDVREACRVHMYDKLGIQHESDGSYGKGWDIIKTEFLSTMRRFFNLNYENLIVVSHESVSEVTKKNGAKITKTEPNIQDKIASKICGMVDIVARVVVEDDDTRTLNFKSDEYVFGGGRLKGITEHVVPLDWNALTGVYDVANGAIGTDATKTPDEPKPATEDVKPASATRKSRAKAKPTVVEEEIDEEDVVEQEILEEDDVVEDEVVEEVKEVTPPTTRKRRVRN